MDKGKSLLICAQCSWLQYTFRLVGIGRALADFVCINKFNRGCGVVLSSFKSLSYSVIMGCAILRSEAFMIMISGLS